MNPFENQDITALLKAWGTGEDAALNKLLPLVYRELKRMARRYSRAGDGRSLETTALVHEAYLRLVDVTSVSWQERSHFFAVAAQIMRRIMVDAARARRSQKRGGQFRLANQSTEVDFDQIPDIGASRADELLAVHDALEVLAQMDSRQAKVVEMRFFGGLSIDEIAEVLGISPQSVKRDWKLAKAWLGREFKKANHNQ